MSELYDSVRSPQKREKRRSPALIAAVLACLLLLGFAVGLRPIPSWRSGGSGTM